LDEPQNDLGDLEEGQNAFYGSEDSNSEDIGMIESTIHDVRNRDGIVPQEEEFVNDQQEYDQEVDELYEDDM